MSRIVNMCIKSRGLHRNVGSRAALNVFLKKAVFPDMLKQPHAVGLDIPGKLGPRNSVLHGSFFLHWCRMNDAAGGN